MVLFGDEREMEKENLERGRTLTHKEMEMKLDFSGEKRTMENKNLVTNRAYPEMEMEMKMKWDRLTFHHEIEVNKENELGPKNKYLDGEMDMGEEEKKYQEKGPEQSESKNYNKADVPPVDDVCPVCFDSFTLPCRSNCGHWFCASCILEFWSYKSSIQPCKCPLCWSVMVNLKPVTSQPNQPTRETAEVLKKVDLYNGLYVGGVRGFFRRLLAFPLLMDRIFRILIHPYGWRCIFYVTRLLGLLLAVLYEKGEYEFVPTGGLGIRRAFDMAGILLVLILSVVGIVYRWMLHGRARRFAAV